MGERPTFPGEHVALMLLSRLSISARFLLVLAVGVAFQAGLSAVSLVNLKASMVTDRVSEVRHLVDAAYGVTAFYHEQAARGAMSDLAARKAAADAVRAMHYDGGNYFFIWTLDGVGVAHGAQPALEGRSFIGSPDALANPVVATMVARLVRVARSPAKEGVTTYRIPRQGGSKPLGKIAYSRLFEPWGWSIGTGAYTDDIDDAFRLQAIRDVAEFVAMIAVAGLLSRVIGRDMVRAMDRLSRRVAGVADGQLDGPVPDTGRRDEIGVIARALLVLRDTSREAAELRLDHLTDLPTRRLLMDRIRQVAARGGGWSALLLIDLDRFKGLNDRHGHDAGDLLLREVARRLLAGVRAGDTVARLGGDEFVVVLVDVAATQGEASVAVEAICQQLSAGLAQPYRLGRVVHDGSASIGVALFSGDGFSADALLKQADLAMYRSKGSGSGLVRFFDPDMERAVHEHALRERELRQAVADGQFVLHYQPQIDRDGTLRGAEALIRWEHPGRGLMPPDDFIGLAEETGLILPLGRWALETACRQLALWAARPETAGLTLAVNVSARQFEQPDFAGQVRAILRDAGADPRRLTLELTESLLASNVEAMRERIRDLKSVGVAFALDDFGIGYSSLSLLKSLPLDQLKIDRSFVRHMLTDTIDMAIANMVVALARTLDLEVVAEGVETQEQWDVLAVLGCHYGQGYLFSRPLPLDRFERFASRQGRLREPVEMTGAGS